MVFLSTNLGKCLKQKIYWYLLHFLQCKPYELWMADLSFVLKNLFIIRIVFATSLDSLSINCAGPGFINEKI